MKEYRMGEIRIADDVVAVIAGTAAAEVDGIVMTSGFYEGFTKRVTGRGVAKGVFVTVEGEQTTIELRICVRFGTNVGTLCRHLQEKVKDMVETLTGLVVREVNVRVEGIE